MRLLHEVVVVPKDGHGESGVTGRTGIPQNVSSTDYLLRVLVSASGWQQTGDPSVLVSAS